MKPKPADQPGVKINTFEKEPCFAIVFSQGLPWKVGSVIIPLRKRRPPGAAEIFAGI
jgi:hypothetical protein